jgi:hypothetical protein
MGLFRRCRRMDVDMRERRRIEVGCDMQKWRGRLEEYSERRMYEYLIWDDGILVEVIGSIFGGLEKMGYP